MIDTGSPPSGREYRSFLASRPDAAEDDAVALVIEAAAATGARAHIVHVSSATVLERLVASFIDGAPATAQLPSEATPLFQRVTAALA